MRTRAIGGASLLFLAASFAGAMLVGCGDDTQAAAPDGGDAGSKADVQPATDSSPGDGGGGGDGGEGGDGACNYAAFVLGLIANHTNGTDQPSTDLGQGCVDDQNQAEFQSLFP